MSDELGGIAEILSRIGKVEGLGPDDDVYDAGFSSMNALELLLELESAYGVSIPDDQFIAARTLRGLDTLIENLRQEQAA